MAVPHFSIPLRVGVDNAVVCLEQDTVDEIAQCVQVLVSTERGSRIELPNYGVSDPTFQHAYDRADAIAAIKQWEPRASVLVGNQVNDLDELLDDVTIAVTRAE